VSSYDYGNIAVATGEGTAEIEVLDAQGTWMPPADQMAPGDTWTHSYTVRVSGEGAGSTSSNSQSFTAVAFESVEVGAGSFEGLRVDATSTVSSAVPGVGDFSIVSDITYWLVYGVGIVRSDSTTQGTSSSTTLVSYSIP
jgi:hypothetical protein